MKKKVINPENALMQLQTICARAEYAESELYDKLRRWGIHLHDANSIITKLRRDRYVDNLRFAKAFCLQKLRYNNWGKKKIVTALYSKRIDRTHIEEAISGIDENEYYDILVALMRSKARQIKEGNTFEGRTKLYRSVIARGFEGSLAGSIIRNNNLNLWE